MSIAPSPHTKTDKTKDEWLTPPEIITSLSTFDLDPCSPINRPWDTALKHYNIKENGLLLPWVGRIWMNPPYGKETSKWMEKLAKHNNGVALIFARTETKIFFPWVWDYADSILFIKGRLTFRHVDGTPAEHNSGGPSALVAYGGNNTFALEQSGIDGKMVYL